MKNWKSFELLQTPAAILIVVGATVFGAELLFMMILHEFLMPWVALTDLTWDVFDAATLTAVVTPLIYFLMRKRQNSEARLRQINDTAQDAIVVIDDQGRITDWNPAAQKIFQYSREEALGQPMHKLIAPPRYHADAARGFAIFQETGEGPLIGKTSELMALRKDGSEFCIEHSISAMKLNGRWHAIGILRDITGRKLTEFALLRSEDNLNRAQAVAQIGSWNFDIASNRLEWSAESHRIFGIPGKEAVDLDTFVSTIHPDDRDRVLKAWNEAVAGAPYDIEHRIVAGEETRWVRERAVIERDAEGRALFGIGTTQDITANKHMDDELRRLSLAVEQSSNSIVITNLDANIEYVNYGFVKATGYSRKEVIGQNPRILQSGKTPRQSYDDMWAHLARGDVWKGEFINRRKDGSEFVESIFVSPVRDTNGHITQYLAIKEDITERRQAEEKQKLFRTLLDNSSDAIEVLDPVTLRFIDINGTACRELGYSREELLSMNIFDINPFISEDIRKTMMAQLRQSGSMQFETVHRCKDGSIFPVEVSSKWIELDKPYMLNIARDITERKQIETAQLFLAESSFRHESENFSQVLAKFLAQNLAMEYVRISLLDGEGLSARPLVSFYDGKLEAGAPYPLKDIPRGSLPEKIDCCFTEDVRHLFPQDAVLQNMQAESYASATLHDLDGKPFGLIEVIGRKPLTNPRPVDVILHMVAVRASAELLRQQADDELQEMLKAANQSRQIMLNMIEDQKLAEMKLAAQYQQVKEMNTQLVEANKQLGQTQNQLLQSEKMAAIGLLAAGVAHEINNPVGYVNSNLGTLEKYLAHFFSIMDKYEAAEVPLGADNPLFQELHQYKAKINLDRIRNDTKALIAESQQGLERVKKIILDLKEFSHADSEDQWVLADVHQGLESTLNVVWNELKYKCEVVREYGNLPKIYCLPSELNQVFMNLLVNAGQAIDVRGTITLRTGQQGDQIWVEVLDTGKGIPPANITRLFEPFFTTKPVGQGTGLGLSVSYRIVEKHHGKIEVQSEVGKGSTFRVWLPVQQPETKEAT